MSLQDSSVYFTNHDMVLFIQNGIFRRCKLAVFSVLLALGTMLGLIWATLDSPKAERVTSLNISILTLICATIGGRAGYLAVHWAYFQDYFIQIPQLWLGGISWPGALAGGILGIFLASLISKFRFGKLADRQLPLVASLSVAVWLGCWLTGCAYGPDSIWGLSIKDEWGIWQQRLPIQLIDATLTVALFWGIEKFKNQMRSTPSGLAASLGLAGLSLILLITSLLRVDPYPLYNGLRIESWASIIFFGIALLSGGITYLTSKHKNSHEL
jgi:prolipoprotein diacylglyceryltransferase